MVVITSLLLALALLGPSPSSGVGGGPYAVADSGVGGGPYAVADSGVGGGPYASGTGTGP